MELVDRAFTLKKEANTVLQEIGLLKLLEPCGGVTFTGSYFLDVMVYPDIDLYIPAVSLDRFFQIAATLAKHPLIMQIKFEKSDDPRLPNGLYLSPRVRYGNWNRPWKIDIWSLDEEVIVHVMESMVQFQSKMTPALRAQILRYKYSVMTPEFRTPVYSGYFIYKAFLDEGLTDFNQVTQYLIDNGINLEPGKTN